MSKPARTGRDAAAEISAIIIDRLEKGVPPWTRPWRTVAAAAGRSGTAARPIRGSTISCFGRSATCTATGRATG
jgi:antirestriction protein ArdC